jgi:hypothetical protein
MLEIKKDIGSGFYANKFLRVSLTTLFFQGIFIFGRKIK